jgi:hypothetical protein
MITPEQEIIREGWQYRAIKHQSGNQTQLGALVIAICGKRPSNPPRIMGSGLIDEDGNILVTFHSRAGQMHQAFKYCTVQEMTAEFSRLADVLQLSDEERIEMFGEVRRWIGKDLRADPILHFSKG